MTKRLKELCDKLDYARSAVMMCLDSADTLVDMHDIVYWAKEVDRLRKTIKEEL